MGWGGWKISCCKNTQESVSALGCVPRSQHDGGCVRHKLLFTVKLFGMGRESGDAGGRLLPACLTSWISAAEI